MSLGETWNILCSVEFLFRELGHGVVCCEPIEDVTTTRKKCYMFWLKQNGWHFANNISKWIFLKECDVFFVVSRNKLLNIGQLICREGHVSSLNKSNPTNPSCWTYRWVANDLRHHAVHHCNDKITLWYIQICICTYIQTGWLIMSMC